MSERLTDEQLRDLQENAEMHDMVHSPAVHSAVAELLDLREMVNAEIVGTERPELIALRAALREIGKRARSDGNRTFDDCISDLGWIDDECRRFTAQTTAQQMESVNEGRHSLR